MTYDKYCRDMKKFKKVPMSEIEFNKMEGIEQETIIPPLQIRPKKYARKIEATMRTYEANND